MDIPNQTGLIFSPNIRPIVRPIAKFGSYPLSGMSDHENASKFTLILIAFFSFSKFLSIFICPHIVLIFVKYVCLCFSSNSKPFTQPRKAQRNGDKYSPSKQKKWFDDNCHNCKRNGHMTKHYWSKKGKKKMKSNAVTPKMENLSID